MKNARVYVLEVDIAQDHIGTSRQIQLEIPECRTCTKADECLVIADSRNVVGVFDIN